MSLRPPISGLVCISFVSRCLRNKRDTPYTGYFRSDNFGWRGVAERGTGKRQKERRMKRVEGGEKGKERKKKKGKEKKERERGRKKK